MSQVVGITCNLYQQGSCSIASHGSSSISDTTTTLLPGQNKLAPSSPMSGASCFVVSCGVRLSEVGLSEIHNPRAGRSRGQSHSQNFDVEQEFQEQFIRLRH